jgi:acetyl esterase
MNKTGKVFYTALWFLIFAGTGSLTAQEDVGAEAPAVADADTVVTYKTIGDVSLQLFIFYPGPANLQKASPAIVFFFGGGWNSGSVAQFEPHAKYFSSLGMVTVLADYRVKMRHGTTPFEAIADARSVMRFLRSNASTLHIDPEKIVASGGSAGGHLAAATAFLKGPDDARDDLSVSTVPFALVLYNPVIDNGPEGYGYERIGKRYKEVSPAHNIREGAPPAIFFLGTDDNLIPVAVAQKFKLDMEAAGSRCDLFLYEGQKHGFFNFRNSEYYQKTLLETEKFLHSIGLIGPR